MNSFAVGCFNLEFEELYDFDKEACGDKETAKKFKEYGEELIEYFNSIENLTELNISPLQYSLIPSFADENKLVPCPSVGKISFKICIPSKVQKKCLNDLFEYGIMAHDDIESENFFVYIYYGYELPVWFISPISNTAIDPSNAVIIIREYLKNHSNNKKMKFLTLGPSPFRCDFFIKNNSEQSFEIIIESNSRIHVDTNEKNFIKIADEFAFSLGYFYSVAQFRSSCLRDQEDIINLEKILIKELKSRDFNPISYFQINKLSKILKMKILSYTAKVSFERRSVNQRVKLLLLDATHMNWEKYLTSKVEYEFEDVEFDLTSPNELINFSTTTGTKTFDLYKSIIVGVLISLVTFSLSYNFLRANSIKDVSTNQEISKKKSPDSIVN